MKLIKKILAILMILSLILGVCDINVKSVQASTTTVTYLDNEALKTEARIFMKKRLDVNGAPIVIMGDVTVWLETTKTYVETLPGGYYDRYHVTQVWKYRAEYDRNSSIVGGLTGKRKTDSWTFKTNGYYETTPTKLAQDLDNLNRKDKPGNNGNSNGNNNGNGNNNNNNNGNNSGNDDVFYNPENDYGNWSYEPAPTPEPENVTVYATSVETNLAKGGVLYFNVKFSEPIKVTKAPNLSVKFGEETNARTVAFANQGKDSLTYKMVLNDTNDCGKTITLEAISDGNVECKRGNTITTMDYETRLTNRNLGTVGNFLLVKDNARGDINKDSRIDELDVKEILSCTDKKIADVNGDGAINETDKNDLQKALDNKNTKYINYLKVEASKVIHGDVVTTKTGTPVVGEDKVINYHDVEAVAQKVGRTLTQNDIERYDVNGDGAVDLHDAIFMEKAITSQDPTYLMYIKCEASYADVCKTPSGQEGVINANDVLAISKLYKEDTSSDDTGDINKDGKVNIYDQIALKQMLSANDLSKTKFFKVFVDALGDVNSDGFLDYRDVTLISQYLLSKNQRDFVLNNVFNVNVADVNKNGKIDLYDTIALAEALEQADKNFNDKAKVLADSYFILPNEDGIGDANGDGVINYYDAEAISKHLLNVEQEGFDSQKADINQDGSVNLHDAIEVMQRLLKLDDTDVAGETEDDLQIDNVYASAILYGDVDQNGIVDVEDVKTLNLYLLNKDAHPLSANSLKAADCSYNGEVNINDSTILMNYVCGMIDAEQLGPQR